MGAIANDTFTDTAKTLTAHTSDSGHTWAQVTGVTGTYGIGNVKDCYHTSAANARYYMSVTPATADYTVQATYTRLSATATSTGVAGRMVTTAQTMYWCRWDMANSQFELYRQNTGTYTLLGNSGAISWTVGTSKVFRLEMVGTSIRFLVDGALMASGTDASITAAGKPGFSDLQTVAFTDTTGMHMDNFVVLDTNPATRGLLSSI